MPVARPFGHHFQLTPTISGQPTEVRGDAETIEDENGKFGWCWDSEDNKLELWEPPVGR